ncbi:cardiolipin synthase [Lentisphaerota bacterium ZTH]|nr:cardiolipin synthase [Lentisphaerota bacterium]WET06900.1 cardiolipin synthase [Lentisphaerota bacterium ZTH]
MYFDYHILFLLFYAVYLPIQLALAAHILFTKHEEPSSAMMWLLVIVLIPVAGMFFYLLLGINNLKNRGSSFKKIQEKVDNSKEKYLGKAINDYLNSLRQFIPDKEILGLGHNRMLDRLLPERYPLSGNDLELLCDGTMAYPRMLEDIRKARHSIRMQSFIIMNDPVGKAIFDALEEQARAGLDVKVLYDSFGSCKAYFSHFFHRYMHKKIPNFKIHAFSPINIFVPWRIQLRNHRKLLVIDGKTAYVGGINISQENTRFTKVPKRKYIHDLHCRITGPAVTSLQFTFLKDWVYATRSKLLEESVPQDFPMQKNNGDSVIRIVDSGPGQNYQGSQRVFYTAAMTAKRSLWIMTPYFVPDSSYVKTLCMTAARGVDVRLIVPQNNNHVFVALATQSLYRTMLSSGVRIFEKRGLFSHAKALMVDEEWAFMGSSNCDIRSFQLNYELDFCVEKGSFISELNSQFIEELTESDEVTLSQVENKSFKRQLLENICALLTPIL